MATVQSPELKPAVDAILDAAKTKLGLQYDSELARHIGVSGMSITKWRRGELSASSRTFLRLLIEHNQIDVMKPRRRKTVEV